jgi:hypothetical protein
MGAFPKKDGEIQVLAGLTSPNFEFHELIVDKSEFVKLFPRLFNLKK